MSCQIALRWLVKRFEVSGSSWDQIQGGSLRLTDFSLALPYRVLFDVPSYETFVKIQISSRNKLTDPSLVLGLLVSQKERMPFHGHHHTSSASAQHDHDASQGGGAFGGSFHGKHARDPGVLLLWYALKKFRVSCGRSRKPVQSNCKCPRPELWKQIKPIFGPRVIFSACVGHIKLITGH